jgi:NTE family protein
MKTFDFDAVVDDKIGYLRDAYNFVTKYGVCKGNYVYEYMGELIEKKTGDKNYSLKQLYQDKKMHLIISTTNLNTESSVYLHALHNESIYADIPLRTGVRMSMSIPFLFEPFRYNDCLFCDGGVLDNYPIQAFDNIEPNEIESIYDNSTPNYKTLGLKLVTQIKNEPRPPKKIEHFLEYSYSYINTFLEENNRKNYTKENYCRTVFVITKSYPLMQFSLTPEEHTDLIDAGSKAVIKYFEQ